MQSDIPKQVANLIKGKIIEHETHWDVLCQHCKQYYKLYGTNPHSYAAHICDDCSKKGIRI